eukprot:6213493-Pleurochrysis_carterae.AAC.1
MKTASPKKRDTYASAVRRTLKDGGGQRNGVLAPASASAPALAPMPAPTPPASSSSAAASANGPDRASLCRAAEAQFAHQNSDCARKSTASTAGVEPMEAVQARTKLALGTACTTVTEPCRALLPSPMDVLPSSTDALPSSDAPAKAAAPITTPDVVATAPACFAAVSAVASSLVWPSCARCSRQALPFRRS